MPLASIAITASVILLLIASCFDLRTGEIPDRVSFALIGVSISIAALASIISLDPAPILISLVVGIAYFAFGYLSFRLGQWGGGDVKILAGIGCSLGYLASAGFHMDGMLPYYISYFVNLGLLAWPYAIIYSLVVGIMKPEVFTRFVSICRKKRTILLVLASFIPSIAVLALDLSRLSTLYLTLPLFVIISVFLKAMEEVALRKTIRISELMEADALVQNLVVGGKLIAKGHDIEGISREQLNEIRRLASEGKIPENIGIRWGIKFVPILFLTFASLLYFGSLLEFILVWLP